MDLKGGDRIVGSKADLARMFDKVAANDVFAICVRTLDPARSTGSASLFSGDKGTYSQVCPPFDAGRLPALARMLAASHVALREACIVRGRRGRESYCLRPDRAEPGAPASLDIDAARHHPGFLAEDGGFAAIVLPRGEDRGEPLFAIYAEVEGAPAKRLWVGHVLWVTWLVWLASSLERPRAGAEGPLLLAAKGA